jgi:hypothetical protein
MNNMDITNDTNTNDTNTNDDRVLLDDLADRIDSLDRSHRIAVARGHMALAAAVALMRSAQIDALAALIERKARTSREGV